MTCCPPGHTTTTTHLLPTPPPLSPPPSPVSFFCRKSCFPCSQPLHVLHWVIPIRMQSNFTCWILSGSGQLISLTFISPSEQQLCPSMYWLLSWSGVASKPHIPLSWLMKTVNNTGPSIDPWETPLVIGCNLSFEPLVMTLLSLAVQIIFCLAYLFIQPTSHWFSDKGTVGGCIKGLDKNQGTWHPLPSSRTPCHSPHLRN